MRNKIKNTLKLIAMVAFLGINFRGVTPLSNESIGKKILILKSKGFGEEHGTGGGV